MTRIAILGGGPAGVGAAFKLRQMEAADVVLFERNDYLGGNAGTFERNGHVLDFGSHRLHPVTEPEVLDDIMEFLGEDLLDRPRHGRIRLRGRWVHFPLKPVDLMFHLQPGFAAGALGDMVKKTLLGKGDEGETFGSILRANLGATICDDFYFPYARKIWGLAPEEMAGIQARRRVSAGSFGKLLKKVFGQIPGLKPKMSGRFYYPRHGFGAISQAYAQKAESLGAEILLGTSVAKLGHQEGRWTLEAESKLGTRKEEFDQIWSTIPLTTLTRLISNDVPEDVKAAADKISYRAMILVYLELETDQFTEFDAHYFPEADLLLTRLSETKNYAVRTEPQGRTVICAEVPCLVGDDTWRLDDASLGKKIEADLARCDLKLNCAVANTWTARLPQAYPLYPLGYEAPFETLDGWVSGLPDFLSYGRQGLFAHDNTHHALFMAYSAAKCLKDGHFDRTEWARYREIFSHHVVED